MKLNLFTIEGDSIIVILALNHPSMVQEWQFEHIISNSIYILHASPLWKARKVLQKCKLLRLTCGILSRGKSFVRLHSHHILSPPPSLSISICSGKDQPPLLSSLMGLFCTLFVVICFMKQFVLKKEQKFTRKIIY
jgi:hypothetical protein